MGTNSDSAACSIGHPSTTVVCMQSYAGNAMGHLSIQPGDVIEVVGATDCGMLEGYVRGVNRSGFFPEHCVQEVNIRQKNIVNVSTPNDYHRSNVLHLGGPGGGGVNAGPHQQQQQQQQEHQQLQQQQQQLITHQQNVAQQYSSATAPRVKKRFVNETSFHHTSKSKVF